MLLPHLPQGRPFPLGRRGGNPCWGKVFTSEAEPRETGTEQARPGDTWHVA